MQTFVVCIFVKDVKLFSSQYNRGQTTFSKKVFLIGKARKEKVV